MPPCFLSCRSSLIASVPGPVHPPKFLKVCLRPRDVGQSSTREWALKEPVACKSRDHTLRRLFASGKRMCPSCSFVRRCKRIASDLYRSHPAKWLPARPQCWAYNCWKLEEGQRLGKSSLQAQIRAHILQNSGVPARGQVPFSACVAGDGRDMAISIVVTGLFGPPTAFAFLHLRPGTLLACCVPGTQRFAGCGISACRHSCTKLEDPCVAFVNS